MPFDAGSITRELKIDPFEVVAPIAAALLADVTAIVGLGPAKEAGKEPEKGTDLKKKGSHEFQRGRGVRRRR